MLCCRCCSLTSAEALCGEFLCSAAIAAASRDSLAILHTRASMLWCDRCVDRPKLCWLGAASCWGHQTSCFLDWCSSLGRTHLCSVVLLLPLRQRPWSTQISQLHIHIKLCCSCCKSRAHTRLAHRVGNCYAKARGLIRFSDFHLRRVSPYPISRTLV